MLIEDKSFSDITFEYIDNGSLLHEIAYTKPMDDEWRSLVIDEIKTKLEKLEQLNYYSFSEQKLYHIQEKLNTISID